jgi:hypothetical protein
MSKDCAFLILQSYTLEQYKSLEEKLAFIDAAVRLGDGDAITAVSIHVEQCMMDCQTWGW